MTTNMRCPTCRQDLRLPPREGNSRKDCPQCGQGLSRSQLCVRRKAIMAESKKGPPR